MTDEEAIRAVEALPPGLSVEDMRHVAEEFVSFVLEQHGFPKLSAAFDRARRAWE